MSEVIHLAEWLRRRAIREMVQSTRVCPRTGEPLDVETCVVLLDINDAPKFVLSQRGWREQTEGQAQWLANHGYHVDERTLRVDDDRTG